jgi:hypothetical protein
MFLHASVSNSYSRYLVMVPRQQQQWHLPAADLFLHLVEGHHWQISSSIPKVTCYRNDKEQPDQQQQQQSDDQASGGRCFLKDLETFAAAHIISACSKAALLLLLLLLWLAAVVAYPGTAPQPACL